jgi:beta-N-acetylhexosaminidase
MIKKILFLILLSLIIVSTITAILVYSDNRVEEENKAVVKPDVIEGPKEIIPTSFCEGVPNNSYIEKLTYTMKLKQLLVPTSTPSELTRSADLLIGFGGYVLVDTLNHYTNPDQIIADSTKLNELGTQDDIPVLIGLDAEGGIVQRLSWYDMKSINQVKSLSSAKRCTVYTEQATTLKALGFNWSLAPVVDVPSQASHWIASRSIDMSPIVTSELANEYVNCIQNENVLSTPKHFPGHGGTSLDSHFEIPVVSKSYDEWLASDAIPFVELSQFAGSIMVGHLRFDKIDPNPSSASNRWMTEILREELQFEGIIVTDDLGMLGAKTSKECAIDIYNALIAGADLAMFPSGHNCNAQDVVVALESMNIDENLIDMKLNRVLDTKRRFLCPN